MYTGNTNAEEVDTVLHAVYPCVYREHTRIELTLIASIGLSLCIQGTHQVKTDRRHNYRFIPVYTGNTNAIFELFDEITVYPCVYREHQYQYNQIHLNIGLSLCIQGTLLL